MSNPWTSKCLATTSYTFFASSMLSKGIPQPYTMAAGLVGEDMAVLEREREKDGVSIDVRSVGGFITYPAVLGPLIDGTVCRSLQGTNRERRLDIISK